MISDTRTPFFSETPSFLGKVGCIPCDFQHEDAQETNGLLCYKVAT